MEPAQQLSLKDLYRGTWTSPVSPCVNRGADWDEALAQPSWWFTEVLIFRSDNFTGYTWTSLA